MFLPFAVIKYCFMMYMQIPKPTDFSYLLYLSLISTLDLVNRFIVVLKVVRKE